MNKPTFTSFKMTVADNKLIPDRSCTFDYSLPASSDIVQYSSNYPNSDVYSENGKYIKYVPTAKISNCTYARVVIDSNGITSVDKYEMPLLSKDMFILDWTHRGYFSVRYRYVTDEEIELQKLRFVERSDEMQTEKNAIN